MTGEAMKANLHATLEAIRMEKLQDYIARGRKFQGLTNDRLRTEWKNSFRQFAMDLMDTQSRQINDDAEAEFTNRGMDTPLSDEDIKPYLELFTRNVDEAMKGLSAERKSEIDREMLDDVERLLYSPKDSKN